MDLIKETLYKATYAAGSIIKKYFYEDFLVTSKDSVNNLVTEVDTLAEKEILNIIKQTFPDHTILSEEIGALPTSSDYQWIIDPIDGTVNFAHRIPICCVSIGVQYKNNTIIGAVYNPMMNEFFFAEKDKGAYLNDVKINVSTKSDFKKSFLVTGFPYHWPDTKVHPIKVFENIVMSGLPIRRLGSAALDLCWVACGRFDGFWEYNLNAWDVAAGYLIVEEAGGRVSDFKGVSTTVNDKETLATNALIHEDLLLAINSTF